MIIKFRTLNQGRTIATSALHRKAIKKAKRSFTAIILDAIDRVQVSDSLDEININIKFDK